MICANELKMCFVWFEVWQRVQFQCVCVCLCANQIKSNHATPCWCIASDIYLLPFRLHKKFIRKTFYSFSFSRSHETTFEWFALRGWFNQIKGLGPYTICIQYICVMGHTACETLNACCICGGNIQFILLLFLCVLCVLCQCHTVDMCA